MHARTCNIHTLHSAAHSLFRVCIYIYTHNKYGLNGRIQEMYRKVDNLQNYMILYRLHPIIYSTRNFLSTPKEIWEQWLLHLQKLSCFSLYKQPTLALVESYSNPFIFSFLCFSNWTSTLSHCLTLPKMCETTQAYPYIYINMVSVAVYKRCT